MDIKTSQLCKIAYLKYQVYYMLYVLGPLVRFQIIALFMPLQSGLKALKSAYRDINEWVAQEAITEVGGVLFIMWSHLL